MAGPVPKAPSPRSRWIIFSVLAAGYFMVFFHRLCPAVVAVDLMRDLHAGGGLIGVLASAYFYPYALMQLPSGVLADTLGPRKTICSFFLLAGLASLYLGVAQTAPEAIAARVAVGLGVAMFFVPTLKILTSWFAVGEFSAMTGLLMAVGGLGALGAAAPLARLSEVIGWRGGFEVIGAATLILTGLIWLLVRDRPEDVGLPPANPLLDGAQKGAARVPILTGVRMVLGERRFWPLPVWFFCVNGIFFSFSGLWGGPYLMHVHGLDKAQTGNVLSMTALAMIFGSPLMSLISDKWLKSRKKGMIGTSFLMLAMTAAMALYPRDFSLFSLHLLTLGMGFAGGAAVIVGFAAVKELFPLEIAGTAVGVANFFPFFGAAVMQPVIGLILESQGQGPNGYAAEAYGLAFRLYAVAALIALVAAFRVTETFGREAARTSAAG